MDTYSENGMQRFELCVFLISKERRNIKGRFDYKADVEDRFFQSLPLRRLDDPILLGRKHLYLMGNGESYSHRRETIQKQLRGEA